MPSERLLKSSQNLDRDGLATMLEALAGRIRDGRVELSAAADTISLDLPDNVKVDVEVTREAKPSGTKLELEVEISWREGDTALSRGLHIG